MLLPEFYTIVEFKTTDDKIRAVIELNPGHAVYKGHFPGQPVVPGVIQLQIIRELFEKMTGKECMLSKVVSAKYYSMITPAEFPVLDMTIQFKLIEPEEYKVTAQITSGETVFTKVRAGFSIQIKKGD
jgi:3-hydroxyacyl-[acyl-carrier-protein] dehydratase